nr:MAG: internal scaffolding protein [Microvirus sp.]
MTKSQNLQQPKDRPFAKRFSQPTMTKQSLAHDADINVIMAKAQRGMLIPGRSKQPQFGDFTAVPEFQDALNIVREAEKSFSELPAALRDRFHNNPAEMLTFLADVNNRAEAVRLGLIAESQPSVLPPAETPVKGENTPPAA